MWRFFEVVQLLMRVCLSLKLRYLHKRKLLLLMFLRKMQKVYRFFRKPVYWLSIFSFSLDRFLLILMQSRLFRLLLFKFLRHHLLRVPLLLRILSRSFKWLMYLLSIRSLLAPLLILCISLSLRVFPKLFLICQQCQTTCATCSSSDSCLSCTGTKKFHQGLCLENCPPNYHNYISTNECTRCHFNTCLTCSGNQPDQCLDCLPTLLL